MAFVYGLVYGMGVGITVTFIQYTVPLTVSWTHFPEHKGRISGIIISGFGFGSSIFSVVATAIINPSNKKADIKHDGDKYFGSDIYDGFPSMLRWLALIFLVLSAIGRDVYFKEAMLTAIGKFWRRPAAI